MKKYFIYSVLLFLVVLVPPALALPAGVTRGVYTWGRNKFTYKFTDDYGVKRVAGQAWIRVYQSHADDLVSFELDWQWGVTFTESGTEYPLELGYCTNYLNQAWYRHALSDRAGLEDWLESHFCEWAVPEVWLSSVYPPGSTINGIRVFFDLWFTEASRDMETEHFHDWYHFPYGGGGYNGDPSLDW